MEDLNVLRELVRPEMLQLILIAACTVIWFAIKRVIKKFDQISNKFDGLERRIDEKVDALRDEFLNQRREFHEEIKEMVRRDVCESHRAEINRRLEKIQEIRGVAFTKNGLAFVNINDESQMRDLYSIMTPDERRAHAAKCQFAGDRDGDC